MMNQMNRLVDWMHQQVELRALAEPGAYRRYRAAAEDQKPNPYGTADALNLLYTLNRGPLPEQLRQGFIRVLQAMQDPASGLFHEPTHHDFHCTAHCVAALEILDARPLHPLAAMQPLLATGALEKFLDSLDWLSNPWDASHQGAGLYAALILTGQCDRHWQDRYFAWLWENADPRSGLWRKGCVPPEAPAKHDPRGIFPSLAGTFHYLFNLQYARRPLHYPRQLVETCLRIWQDREFDLPHAAGFADIDFVYCLNRASRQCGQYGAKVKITLRQYALALLEKLQGIEARTDGPADCLHSLLGVACALAELQAALPGELVTDRPLRLVLDRRPFI